MDCVPIRNFVRQIVVVPDMYDVVQSHGARQRMNQLPNTKEERALSKYFQVSGYPFTSLPERDEKVKCRHCNYTIARS